MGWDPIKQANTNMLDATIRKEEAWTDDADARLGSKPHHVPEKFL
ncbi:unnamed protein product [Pararhodospirillum photometricum DSM 122]|uniref:Uncharacterized protein n=1 Tax=Pararhodospirillum photometricum DSM 122 TaxID=1150469 RepID=H6SPE8_PARPM|nr:unnamed protein product [Pararhodospirillum photometricum DSM 122]